MGNYIMAFVVLGVEGAVAAVLTLVILVLKRPSKVDIEDVGGTSEEDEHFSTATIDTRL